MDSRKDNYTWIGHFLAAATVMIILLGVLLGTVVKGMPAPVLPQLTFQWTNSNEADQVTEFVLYYGNTDGGPYDWGSIAIPYADCTVVGEDENGTDLQNAVAVAVLELTAGQLHHLYFVLTAKNAAGEESVYSNQVDAEIDLRLLRPPEQLTITVRIVTP